MDLPSPPSPKQPITGALFSFLQIAAALNSLPSAKQVSTSDYRTAPEELQKWRAVAFMVLTFNSGLAAYLLWGDALCVASVGLTYLVIVLLLARHFGCWEPVTPQGSFLWQVKLALIVLIVLAYAALLASRVARTLSASAAVHQASWVARTASASDAVFLASRVARTAAPPSASALLVAAAGATALGLGGCCSYLLHRRSCSKQQRQQMMILPLVLESRS
ncbi:unnamed protein product [Urochloa humidicola]